MMKLTFLFFFFIFFSFLFPLSSFSFLVLVLVLFSPFLFIVLSPPLFRRRTERAAEHGKLSVSGQFKNSLLDLMDKMLAAQPHFIR